jgi:hypothetical protein
MMVFAALMRDCSVELGRRTMAFGYPSFRPGWIEILGWTIYNRTDIYIDTESWQTSPEKKKKFILVNVNLLRQVLAGAGSNQHGADHNDLHKNKSRIYSRQHYLKRSHSYKSCQKSRSRKLYLDSKFKSAFTKN